MPHRGFETQQGVKRSKYSRPQVQNSECRIEALRLRGGLSLLNLSLVQNSECRIEALRHGDRQDDDDDDDDVQNSECRIEALRQEAADIVGLPASSFRIVNAA